MRRAYFTGSLAFTALFWLFNCFTGSFNLISYWYVLFGFALSGLVNHHDYDRRIPQWFTGGIIPCASLGAWLLLNYPVLFFLGVVAMQVYAAGGIRAATQAFSSFLLEGDGAGGQQQGGSIALVLGDVSPSTQSLREETENLARLCTIKPPSEGFTSNQPQQQQQQQPQPQQAAITPPAPALPPPAASVPPVNSASLEETQSKNVITEQLVVPLEEVHSVDSTVETEEAPVTDDSDTDTPSPSRLRTRSAHLKFPTLPLSCKKSAQELKEYYDASDSASDSDHAEERSILSRRGARELHISKRFARADRFGMSRFAQQADQAQDENVVSPPMTRSLSTVDQDTPHGMRFKPERPSRPAETPFPELPAVFRERFMPLKSPSAINAEARNKFMRAETVRSIALGRRG